MVGIYADCNLADRSFRARAEKVIDISFNRLIDAIRVVPQVKQFELRIAKRPGLPSEIASALWQKGVHIQAFSAQLQRTEAALLIDLREAAQIVYEAVWADPAPADPTRTYQSAAQALLNELCQRAGIMQPPGAV